MANSNDKDFIAVLKLAKLQGFVSKEKPQKCL